MSEPRYFNVHGCQVPPELIKRFLNTTGAPSKQQLGRVSHKRKDSQNNKTLRVITLKREAEEKARKRAEAEAVLHTKQFEDYRKLVQARAIRKYKTFQQFKTNGRYDNSPDAVHDGLAGRLSPSQRLQASEIHRQNVPEDYTLEPYTVYSTPTSDPYPDFYPVEPVTIHPAQPSSFYSDPTQTNPSPVNQLHFPTLSQPFTVSGAHPSSSEHSLQHPHAHVAQTSTTSTTQSSAHPITPSSTTPTTQASSSKRPLQDDTSSLREPKKPRFGPPELSSSDRALLRSPVRDRSVLDPVLDSSASEPRKPLLIPRDQSKPSPLFDSPVRSSRELNPGIKRPASEEGDQQEVLRESMSRSGTLRVMIQHILLTLFGLFLGQQDQVIGVETNLSGRKRRAIMDHDDLADRWSAKRMLPGSFPNLKQVRFAEPIKPDTESSVHADDVDKIDLSKASTADARKHEDAETHLPETQEVVDVNAVAGAAGKEPSLKHASTAEISSGKTAAASQPKLSFKIKINRARPTSQQSSKETSVETSLTAHHDETYNRAMQSRVKWLESTNPRIKDKHRRACEQQQKHEAQQAAQAEELRATETAQKAAKEASQKAALLKEEQRLQLLAQLKADKVAKQKAACDEITAKDEKVWAADEIVAQPTSDVALPQAVVAPPQIAVNTQEVLVLPLNDRWTQKVSEISSKARNKVIVKTVGGTELRRSDFDRLLSTADSSASWLNDEIVDGWFASMTKAYNESLGLVEYTHTPKIWAYKSAWYLAVQNNGWDIKAIARWSRRPKISGTKLLTCDRILFPVNTGAHWIVAVISPGERKIEVLDSFSKQPTVSGDSRFVLPLLRQWLAMELGSAYHPEEWTLAASVSTRQLNTNDCGVMACMNGLASAKGMPFDSLIAVEGMPEARKMVAAVLLNGGFTGEWAL